MFYSTRFLFFFLIIAVSLIASDNKLHLVHADKTIGKTVNNERIHIWSGNVEAYQDTVFMYCDSSVFYEVQDKAIFIGNVLIDDGHHKLWANKIVYETKIRLATCYGNVRISGTNDSLFSDLFIYSFRNKSAKGKGNVFIWNKENGSMIWGDNGEYSDSLKESHISGNAKLIKPNKTQNDTLIVTSKIMDYYGNDSTLAIATDSVNIFQNNLFATCDSAVYDIEGDKVFLRVNPLAWQSDNKMSGSQINLELDSLKLKQIFVIGNAEVKTKADSIEDIYNTLQGESIQVIVENDEPQIVIAREHARSIYLIKEKNKKQGTNAASSDSIIIYFQKGVADSIIIAGGTEGTFYPPDYKGEFKSEH